MFIPGFNGELFQYLHIAAEVNRSAIDKRITTSLLEIDQERLCFRHNVLHLISMWASLRRANKIGHHMFVNQRNATVFAFYGSEHTHVLICEVCKTCLPVGTVRARPIRAIFKRQESRTSHD